MMLGDNKVKYATFNACLEAICNMGHSPYIVVYAKHPMYRGPAAQHEESGTVILSIAPSAAQNYFANEEGIVFSYSQGGLKAEAYIPMEALAAIYAKEDQSMAQAFPYKMLDIIPESVKVEPTKQVKKGWKPKIIKGGKA